MVSDSYPLAASLSHSIGRRNLVQNETNRWLVPIRLGSLVRTLPENFHRFLLALLEDDQLRVLRRLEVRLSKWVGTDCCRM